MPSDLTTYARIRNAALEGFALAGIASTSIRDVAAAAGVSPGLVQHHFGTKAGLRDAVNAYVIAVAVEAFEGLAREGDTPEGWAAMGDSITAFVRDNAVALRYVARAIVEGDAEAAIWAMGRALPRTGIAADRSGPDRRWRASHHAFDRGGRDRPEWTSVLARLAEHRRRARTLVCRVARRAAPDLGFSLA